MGLHRHNQSNTNMTEGLDIILVSLCSCDPLFHVLLFWINMTVGTQSEAFAKHREQEGSRVVFSCSYHGSVQHENKFICFCGFPGVYKML